MTEVPKLIYRDASYIMGLKARTSNFLEEDTHTGCIPGLWESFIFGDVSDRITDKIAPGSFFELYTDYEKEYLGEYTVIVGCEVDNFKQIPNGLVVRTIPAGTYAVITVHGPIRESVRKAWKKIKTMSKTDLGGLRAFTTDFEVLEELSVDYSHGKVSIYLALE